MQHPYSSEQSQKVHQKALAYYQILNSENEDCFDHLVRLASRVIQAPIAYISFMDNDREWFKSIVGLDITETERFHDLSFFATKNWSSMEIEDLLQHPEFKEHPLVQGPPYLRSYLGAPIIDPEGNALGSISAVDTVPRSFDEKDRLLLIQEAEHIINLLDARLKEKSKEKTEQELSLKVMEAVEVTRDHVGKEIHDGLAQNITAVSMFFEHFKIELQEAERERLSDQIDAIEKNLQEMMKEARGVSHDLMLKDLHFGLGEAIKKFLAPFDGVKNKLCVDYSNGLGNMDLTDIQKKEIYRMVQEILNNAMKHANASQLRIALSEDHEKGTLCLHAEDNGSGCALSSNDRSIGSSIHERVRGLQGTMRTSNSKGGISFDIQIPIRSTQE